MSMGQFISSIFSCAIFNNNAVGSESFQWDRCLSPVPIPFPWTCRKGKLLLFVDKHLALLAVEVEAEAAVVVP